MKITVTQEHINNGSRFNTNKCPIALAVREQFPKAHRIVVGSKDIYVERWFLRHYKLPEVATVFIYNFDNIIPVQPIEFEAKRRLW